MPIPFNFSQTSPIKKPQNRIETFKNTQEHPSRIKPTFLGVMELKNQHIIYQNDENNTYYNMESSKQSNKHVYKNSSFKSYKFEFWKINIKSPDKSAHKRMIVLDSTRRELRFDYSYASIGFQ